MARRVQLASGEILVRADARGAVGLRRGLLGGRVLGVVLGIPAEVLFMVEVVLEDPRKNRVGHEPHRNGDRGQRHDRDQVGQVHTAIVVVPVIQKPEHVEAHDDQGAGHGEDEADAGGDVEAGQGY